MLIIATVASAAIPRFGNTLGRRRLMMAAQRLQQDIKLAQAKAIQTSAPYLVRFNEGNCLYKITTGTRAATGLDHATVNLGEEPYSMSALEASYTPGKTLAIDGFGVLDQAGTVTLIYGREVIIITLDTDGGASIAPQWEYR
ncbi:MAG: hypothetical protein JNG88_01950 [Phycisphaerales bacterium]|nr:hypothetical protein [Phycisphaerales bacterium]